MQYSGFVAEISHSKIFSLNLPSIIAGENGTIYLDSVNDTNKIWIEFRGGGKENLNFRKTLPNDMIFELKAFDGFVGGRVQPVQENENSIITAEILDEVRRQTGTVFPSDEVLP